MSCSTNNKIQFELIRGDDKTFRFTVVNDSTGQPHNIEGWVLTMTLKRNRNDSDDHSSLSVIMPAQPAALSDSEIGIAYIILNKTVTKNLLPVPYFFDIQRDFRGISSTIMMGRMRVLPDVTRDFH